MNALRGIPGRTFDYDDENHLLSAGGTTYQYDVDGFLTDKIQGLDVTEYVYSSRGELLQVDLPGGTLVEYVHDPLGRRIAKKVDGVTMEKYLWQGLTRLLAVYDGSDALVMRFEYADGRMPVSMSSGGATYYLAYDQVGSLRVVADASGNVVKRIDYDSFGNVIGDTNPTFEVPFGFAGGLHDRDTGLVRFGFRDYDPDVGRWTAKDPIGFAGGDTDLYGYCLNDPVNWVDPEALFRLPGDPDEVARDPRWTEDRRHRNPDNTGDRKFIDRDGREIYWNPGRPEHPSPRQRTDHWHDRQNYGRRHLNPGDEIPDPPSVPPAFRFPWRWPGPYPVIINPCIINPSLPGCSDDDPCS